MGLGRKLHIAMFMIHLLLNMVAAVLFLQVGTVPALPLAPLRHLHHLPGINIVHLLIVCSQPSFENHCLPGKTTTPLFNCKSPFRQTLSPMSHTALRIMFCKNPQVKKQVFCVHKLYSSSQTIYK